MPPTRRQSARTCTPWFAATCARCARADGEIGGRRAPRSLPKRHEPPLRLVQPSAALAEKRDSLGRELKGRARMVCSRLHITPGDKPLQIAFLIAGRLRMVILSDAAEQRD